jgi:hypothetical protein
MFGSDWVPLQKVEFLTETMQATEITNRYSLDIIIQVVPHNVSSYIGCTELESATFQFLELVPRCSIFNPLTIINRSGKLLSKF